MKRKYPKKVRDKWKKYIKPEASQLYIDSLLSWFESKNFTFDPELIEFLNNLMNDSENMIAVHRTGDREAQSICSNGLKLTGHISSGIKEEDPELERNISPCGDLLSLVVGVFAGSTYRYCGPGSKTGVVLISIPKNATQQDILETRKNGGKGLKTDYILGYVEADFPEVGQPARLTYVSREKASEEYQRFVNENNPWEWYL